MGRVEGKVAFITGAARGQGRSHAVRLAQEGADIIAVDICGPIPNIGYPHATPEDLEQTVKEVEALDRRIIATQTDVRDRDGMKRAIDEGVAQLGHLDIVVANAGICILEPWDKVTPETWQETIDINLTGVWNTIQLTAPHLVTAGGGSIILTSSAAGLKGMPFISPYVAAKHGVVGLMRGIRCRARRAQHPRQQRPPHRREHPDGLGRRHGSDGRADRGSPAARLACSPTCFPSR